MSLSQSKIVEEENFEILPSIDKAFLKFGQSLPTVVYWKFHFDTKLERKGIQQCPDLFSKTLRDIFRDGSCIIEQAIIEELKIQFNLPNRNYKDLEDVVNSVRLRSFSETDYTG